MDSEKQENVNPAPRAGSTALDEEIARAELYGLLAQLWWAPPDEALRRAFAVAVTEAPVPGAFLEEPWRRLVGAVRETSAAAARAEYDALFGGVGKPEIHLFGSHYLSGFLNDKPLVRLRDDLARLGLARDPALVGETEDHVACVCEVMRYLIAGDDVAVANLTNQRQFFVSHVQSWLPALCETVQAHPSARLYAALAGFTRAFVQVEAQGFDMLDGHS